MKTFLSPLAPENLVSRDGFGRPVPRHPARFSTLRLNLVLAHGIPPDPRGDVHLSIPPTAIGPVPIRVYRVTQMRTDGVYCRESVGTGPVVLKVVPVTSAALAGHLGPINVRVSFLTPTIGLKWAC